MTGIPGRTFHHPFALENPVGHRAEDEVDPGRVGRMPLSRGVSRGEIFGLIYIDLGPVVT